MYLCIMIQEVIVKTSKENRRKILKNLLLNRDMLKLPNTELGTTFDCTLEDVKKARVKVNILKHEKFGKDVKTILMWLYEKENIVHNPFSEINSFN
jgi:hypothetical protein